MSQRQRGIAGIGAGLIGIWVAFWRQGPPHLLSAFVGVLTTIETWLLDSKKARCGLAVTRILLGCTALGIWTTNFRSRYYIFGSGAAWSGPNQDADSGLAAMWLFSSFRYAAPNDIAVTLLYVLVGFLAISVILGYRTRLLLPVFTVLWVSLVEAQDLASDQGDNIFRIALIGLIFADPSGCWSLDARRRNREQAGKAAKTFSSIFSMVLPEPLPTLAHNLVIVALTCQVIFVYVSGALYKAGGTPWREGTAVYAPLQTVRFGPWPELSDLVTSWGPGVAIASIGSILIQIVFPGALLFRWTRIPALFAMVGFHLGIAVLMGLPWFSLAMVAIDAIFIRDLTWQRVSNWVVIAWNRETDSTEDRSSYTISPTNQKALGQVSES